MEILNRTVWKSGWFSSPNAAAVILRIYSPVWAMAQNVEGKGIGVNSGKVLERKLKRPGNQSGGGATGEERRILDGGEHGWPSLASPGEGVEEGGKERNQANSYHQWGLVLLHDHKGPLVGL